jgi:hypothetical protein
MTMSHSNAEWIIWAEQIKESISFGMSYYIKLALLLAIMVMALIAAYRVWAEIHDVEEPDSPTDLLRSFEEARGAGALDEAEFNRVQSRLGVAPTRTGESPPTGLQATDEEPLKDFPASEPGSTSASAQGHGSVPAG